jgi:cellulose synthase (UDP-forming)
MKPSPTAFLATTSSRTLIYLTGIGAIVYFAVIAFVFPADNVLLFSLLIFGEVFHTWQSLTYLHTIRHMGYEGRRNPEFAPAVDVFITVAGEPADIVEETAIAARDMAYPNHKVYLLNDGYVAKKDNWQEIELLAERLGIGCFTRKTPGGAKAGNINNALAQTVAPYVVIFDADHIPHSDFLEKTVPYFEDPLMGFVQTPQFYKNADLNDTTRGAWEQQELFYGPICRGKNHHNAATMCGTNMVISRKALGEVGGMCTESIAEDFATGMFIHEKGYKSAYVSEVLAEGLAPEDFLSYTKQQFRWARGALDVIFRYNLLMRRGLTFAQKLQYLSSVTFFLSGIVVLINIALPLVFLYSGIVPIKISGMFLAAVFIPYIFLTLYNLSMTSNYRFTFRALSFAISGFWIQLQALWSALTKQKVGFAITSKRAVEGSFVNLVAPHLVYVTLVAIGIAVALMREGFSPSFVNNLAWALFNIGVFVPFIYAAAPELKLSRLFNLQKAKVRIRSLFGKVRQGIIWLTNE